MDVIPSASATTTFEPQAGGENAPINPHPRRRGGGGQRRWGIAVMAGCEAVCDLVSGRCLRWEHLRREELAGLAR